MTAFCIGFRNLKLLAFAWLDSKIKFPPATDDWKLEYTTVGCGGRERERDVVAPTLATLAIFMVLLQPPFAITISMQHK